MAQSKIDEHSRGRVFGSNGNCGGSVNRTFDCDAHCGRQAVKVLQPPPFKNLSKPYRRDAYVVHSIYGVVDDCKPCMHLLLWCRRRRAMITREELEEFIEDMI